MRILTAILLGLVVYFQYQLWFGYNGYEDYRDSLKEVQALRQKVSEKAERNAQLKAQIADFKEGSDAVEEIAREEYGFKKSDEVFFHTQ